MALAKHQTASRSFGRTRELGLLQREIDLARKGRLEVVLLTGEPGIGKTHLLDAATRHAADSGMLVLRGGASDAEGMPPYLPFLEALGQHIRSAPPERLRSQLGT